MKLVDILARELKAWPGNSINMNDYCVQSDKTTQIYFGAQHENIYLSERAETTAGVKVTRAEWQAAVDALNAPKVVEWHGKGNPPAGSSIEYSIGDGWYSCEVRYVLNRDDYPGIALVAWCEHLGKDQYLSNDRDHKFRPARTAEQEAAEEREKAITLMIDESLCGHYAFTKAQAEIACKALYEAGYRKEPKPCGS